MRSLSTKNFDRAFKKLPREAQLAFGKQLIFLLRDLRHPSLRAKKYDESAGIWQARVTGNVRFYFVIKDDTYVLLDITKHPK